MPIPNYDALMLPILRMTAQKTWQMRDLVRQISDDLRLSPEDREALLPGGSATVIASRVAWAKTYLKQAGLVEQPQRAVVRVSELGAELLSRNPTKVDLPLLRTYVGFQAFMRRTVKSGDDPAQSLDSGEATVANTSITEHAISNTPEEQIASASNALDEALRDALLTRVLEVTPAFFEHLILKLMRAMRYGGLAADADQHLGGSGDGGVDGVVKEDQLGLDRIYLQAKRYGVDHKVAPADVQGFIGALVNKNARKGVFITTSSFTTAALDVAARAGDRNIVLIDGTKLTKLMLRHNVGVKVYHQVEIKRIDLDFFEPDDHD